MDFLGLFSVQKFRASLLTVEHGKTIQYGTGINMEVHL